METYEELYVFADNVRELREHFGYSNKEFAQIMRSSVTTVKKLGTGNSMPAITIKPVFRLAVHFRVPINRMFAPHVLELVLEQGWEKPVIDSSARAPE